MMMNMMTSAVRRRCFFSSTASVCNKVLLEDHHRMLGPKQTERTFLAIKPDGVQRALVGNVISRLESRGLKIVGLKIVKPTREIAEQHYEEHKDREFFERACRFLCGKSDKSLYRLLFVRFSMFT